MPKEKECCPKFNPKPWDGKTYKWNKKVFIKKTIPQIFHIPFPWVLNKAITQMWELAQKHGIAPAIKDFLLLAHDPSPWKSELYLAVKKESKEIKTTAKISGTFISKVFDGPYHEVPKYIAETDKYLKAKKKKAKKFYFYFTTCPRCAKKYGHNYIVAFAEV
jgi:effector-binding domain-containing protein